MLSTIETLVMTLTTVVSLAPEPGPLPSFAEGETQKVEVTDAAVKKTLVEAFAAALVGDFKRYAVLVHASEKTTPAQLAQLERFTFTRFVRQSVWYLKDEKDAASFVIDRTEDLGGDKVRVFLKDVQHPSRPSVPITFGTAAGGAVILSNSL
jgi:hypothetical protein